VTDPLDPVTFEVIRHRLWAINDDQARMGARLSGTPIIYEGYDFNAALVTADGRGLYTGVYIMHHGATIDGFVRKVLTEWPSEEIREGDMFFTNDPWWGALHANDGILAMPIFWEGELVAWSGIVMHDDDVGSPVPGSFVSGAKDRFGEAPLFPAIKMVENFEPRWDVERAYLRNSRTPGGNALNMRARIAALRTTYRRIGELIGQYGLSTFLAAQEGIIDYVERVVRRRLSEIPDGSWYAQGYHDHDGNENNVYAICCRVIKRGDSLVFDMTGTAPQAIGSINCARPAMEGAVMGVILTFLCYDLPWAIAGLHNLTEIISEPGTLNNALSPAGVSMASITGTLSTQDVIAHAFAKMLLSSERYRQEAQGTWSPGISGVRIVTRDADGEPALARITDTFGGGGGARTFTDGIDSGGIFHSMASRVSNVEALEARGGILQVYRRELPDSGGAGRFRGGATIEFAGTTHKAGEENVMLVRASGVLMPGGRGLSGGSPGAAVHNVVLRGSDIRRRLAEGRVPVSATELSSNAIDVQDPKTVSTISADDFLIGTSGSGSGYGDPLRREPQSVLHDVRIGLVSAEAARSIYGVVLRGPDADSVDEAATAAARDAQRAQRLGESRPVAVLGTLQTIDGDVIHPVSDTVEAVQANGERALRCSLCHHRFGPYDADHKHGSLMRERPLTAISSLNALCSERFVAREFCCPGCGTAVAMDIQERDEPILDECRFVAPAATV
jgi:N-methylhydantoinase B